MPLLFSYGTLQEEDVQRDLFGRTLTSQKDVLLGYRQELAEVKDPEFACTSGKSLHAILRWDGSDLARVEGSALEVSEAELNIADEYEPVEYKRVLAQLASGKETWVYVDAKSAG